MKNYLSTVFFSFKPSFYKALRNQLLPQRLCWATATILVTFVLATSLSAQSPGGVSSDLKLWLRGDAGVTLAGGDVSEWADQGPGAYTATQLFSDRRPEFTASSSLFNCNPSVDFDLSLDAMTTTVLMYNPDYTFFVVYNSTSTSTAGRRAVAGDNNWLIGPHGNNVGYHAGPWVEHAQIPSNVIPTISTATSNGNATNNAFFYYNGEDRTPTGVTTSLALSLIHI